MPFSHKNDEGLWDSNHNFFAFQRCLPPLSCCISLLFDSENKLKLSKLRFLWTQQACSHSLTEENVAISLAATGECSSCQCLSASALLVVFPVACPYSSLFVTAFRSRRIVVCMYRD